MRWLVMIIALLFFLMQFGCVRESHYYRLDKVVLTCRWQDMHDCGMELSGCSDGTNRYCALNVQDLGPVKP